jgi:hypothetical protein
MVSRNEADWDLREDPPPQRARCAFCLQQVEVRFSIACPRCRAFCHPDCWKANDGRCPVYACEPVTLPPAPPPPPTSSPRSPRRPGIAVMGFIAFLVISNLARVGTHSRVHQPEPYTRTIFSAPRTDRAALPSEARALVDETRPLIKSIEEGPRPEDPKSRDLYVWQLEYLATRLQRARDLYELHQRTYHDFSNADRIRELTETLERLQKLHDTPSRPEVPSP